MSNQPGPRLDGSIAVMLFNHFYSDNNPDLPQYSTTWEGMGLIVEEMKLRGFDVALESSTDPLHDGRTLYHARFFRRIEGHYGEYDSAISFSHAVCMAALNALYGQDDD